MKGIQYIESNFQLLKLSYNSAMSSTSLYTIKSLLELDPAFHSLEINIETRTIYDLFFLLINVKYYPTSFSNDSKAQKTFLINLV